MSLEEMIIADVLSTQDLMGANLLYQQAGSELMAIHLDEKGDEVARYTVHFSLERT